MSPSLTAFCLTVAVVLFVLAAFEVRMPRHPFNFGWLGAAFFALVPLVAAVQAL